MILWLTPEQAEQIGRQALGDAPHETCGILGGVGHHVMRVVPITNTADDPAHHYRLDEAAFVQAVFEFERAGLSLVGIYHSHPKGDPIPSRIDIQQANYPNTAYLIVGLRTRQPALSAWQLNYGQVGNVPLYIQNDPPDTSEHLPLTRAQIIAILITAILTFAFMIVLSFALLPPAPELVR